MDAPRRCYVEKRSLSETAIADAVEVVEQMPADERLTAAVVLLGQAQDKVAEWVDANLGHPASTPVGPRIEQPQSLAERITRAINCVSAENGSNTPDFILAEYLTDYASEQTKRDGFALIEKEAAQIADEKTRCQVRARIEKITTTDERDLCF